METCSVCSDTNMEIINCLCQPCADMDMFEWLITLDSDYGVYLLINQYIYVLDYEYGYGIGLLIVNLVQLTGYVGKQDRKDN